MEEGVIEGTGGAEGEAEAAEGAEVIEDEELEKLHMIWECYGLGILELDGWRITVFWLQAQGSKRAKM